MVYTASWITDALLVCLCVLILVSVYEENVYLFLVYLFNVTVARLQYDNVSGSTFNQPGVQIRQPDFGNTSTVEWLDSSHLSHSVYTVCYPLFYFVAVDLCLFYFNMSESVTCRQRWLTFAPLVRPAQCLTLYTHAIWRSWMAVCRDLTLKMMMWPVAG